MPPRYFFLIVCVFSDCFTLFDVYVFIYEAKTLKFVTRPGTPSGRIDDTSEYEREPQRFAVWTVLGLHTVVGLDKIHTNAMT